MNTKASMQIRKFLLGILLAGLTLSICFGISGSPAARAQVAWTATPSDVPSLEATPEEGIVEPQPTEPTMDFLSKPPSLSTDGLTLYDAVAPLVIVADPNPAMQGVKIPTAPALTKTLVSPAAASATFTFTFLASGSTDPWAQVCQTFPDNAKAAFTAAAAIWANTIKSVVPIKIEACWASLSSTSILGYSGGENSFRDFIGAPQASTWYESSLANALHGSSLGATFDDYITYNSNFSWYYGTDSNPPAGQYDLVTVAAHEINHGLNFSGSAQYSAGTGQYGSNGYPFIFDKFMQDSIGTHLTSYANPSTALGTLLTSGSLWFNGTNANAANGGLPVRMYAPSTWSSGSSYSHLDYNTFAGTANSMMVFAIGSGSANHNPGPVTVGILKDLGWPLSDSTLTVNKSGTGTGTVTSNPTGINCGSTCSYAFTYNTNVTLTAAATSPSTFGGWRGAGCSGTGTCTITMNTAQSVTATFNPGAQPVSVDSVFTTDQNGLAAVSGNNPQVIPGNGLTVKPAITKTEFNPGDPIWLFVEANNQNSTDETASFQWIVKNPAGQDVPALEWSGNEDTAAGILDWYISSTIPAGSPAGKYTFTGKITFNGVTTSASTNFYVSGSYQIYLPLILTNTGG